MPDLLHTAIFTDTASRKREFAQDLLEGRYPEAFSFLSGLEGAYFSNSRLDEFIEDEARHGRSGINPEAGRNLQTFSSGERKKALLEYLLRQEPDYLILDDPFDNLDREYQKHLKTRLQALSSRTLLLQFLSRHEDKLPYMQNSARLQGDKLIGFPNYQPPTSIDADISSAGIPPPPFPYPNLPNTLITFNEASVRYGSKPILNRINWSIQQGDFWELRGPNGSGKTTLITMITGDNPKAYGQDIHIFGRRKGSGESVWDIKQQIGYFTPAMTDRFRGYHSIRNMIISGLTDSIGLYTEPSDKQSILADQWLTLIGMEAKGDALFADLSSGAKRLLLCARAMVKHPPLLILDEPTAGLDDTAASLVVGLIQKMARESKTAVIFVSHRKEKDLHPERVLELLPGDKGSTVRIL